MEQLPKNIEIGRLGEEFACNHLRQTGFRIIKQNYWRPWGEIDIIAKKGGEWHFVEVKSICCTDVNRETPFAPEVRVDGKKRSRLAKVINTYLEENQMGESDWVFDVISVYLNESGQLAKIEVYYDVLL